MDVVVRRKDMKRVWMMVMVVMVMSVAKVPAEPATGWEVTPPLYGMLWKSVGEENAHVETFMVFVEIAVKPVKEIKVAIMSDTRSPFNEDLRKRNYDNIQKCELYYIPWYRYEVLTNKKRVRFYDENDEVIADMVFEWWPARNRKMEKKWKSKDLVWRYSFNTGEKDIYGGKLEIGWGFYFDFDPIGGPRPGEKWKRKVTSPYSGISVSFGWISEHRERLRYVSGETNEYLLLLHLEQKAGVSIQDNLFSLFEIYTNVVEFREEFWVFPDALTNTGRR